MPVLAKVTIHNCQCARDHNPHFKIPARVVTSGGAHFLKMVTRARAPLYIQWYAPLGAFPHCARCKILHKKIARVLLYIQWYLAPFGAFYHCNILHIWCILFVLKPTPVLTEMKIPCINTVHQLNLQHNLKQCTVSDKFNALHNDIQLSPIFAKTCSADYRYACSMKFGVEN